MVRLPPRWDEGAIVPQLSLPPTSGLSTFSFAVAKAPLDEVAIS